MPSGPCWWQRLTLAVYRIHLHFEHSIQEVDWHGRAATFSRPDGTTAVATYDLLLAADGRHSKTRGLYQEHEPTFTSFQRRGDKDYLTFSGFMLPGMPQEPLWLGSWAACSPHIKPRDQCWSVTQL